MDTEMDKKERKRLETLQEDGHKEIDKWNLEKLTYPDFQLLLLADPVIQRLIRQIVKPMLAAPDGDKATQTQPGDDDTADNPLPDEANDADSAPSKKSKKGDKLAALAASQPTAATQHYLPLKAPAPVSEYRDREVIKEVIVYRDREVIKEVIKEVVKKVPHEVRVEVPVYDPLRTELAAELALLKAVQADTELAGAWLWAAESEGRQLVRLLAMLSEWDEVLSLWGRLADRCKNGQRAATAAELTVLQAALALHNLRWRDRAARLVQAEVGATFHHETMERGSPKGSTVAEVWLPGLDNAAGQVQKKPVVKTT